MSISTFIFASDIPKVMPSLMICALTFALCVSYGFQQGYMGSLINVEYIFIAEFINTTIHERMGVHPSPHALNLIFSSFNIILPIASIVGQFLAAWSCKRFGRKGTALLSCTVLYIPGTLLSTISAPVRSFELLFIGRILWSLANGIASVTATVWIVECAPPSIRGAMAALQEFTMATIGLPLSTPALWPLVFLPNAFLLLVAVLIFVLVPESPVSILEREQDMNKGVAWMFNPCAHVDDRMRVVRQAAWLGVMVKIAYIFTGTRTLRSYSAFVLHYLSHFTLTSAIYGSWIISLLRVPFTLVPVLFVDRIGRRPLIIFSLILTVFSLALLMTSIAIGDSMQIVSLVSFAAVVLVNGAGLGSVSRFYAAELVPRSVLLEAMSILSGIEAFTKIFVDFAFYPVANLIGVHSLLIFAVPSFLFLLSIWALCPETSCRSVQQVLDGIAKRKNLKVSFGS